MCTHSIDNLLPHALLHYAATGDIVKCFIIIKMTLEELEACLHNCDNLRGMHKGVLKFYNHDILLLLTFSLMSRMFGWIGILDKSERLGK